MLPGLDVPGRSRRKRTLQDVGDMAFVDERVSVMVVMVSVLKVSKLRVVDTYGVFKNNNNKTTTVNNKLCIVTTTTKI